MPPKYKALLELASAVSGAWGLRAKIRDARQNQDRLVLLDSLITALGLITGTALAIRTLRNGDAEARKALEREDR